MTPLARLGKAVAGSQADAVRAEVERASQTFDEAVSARLRARVRPRTWIALAAAALGALMVALLLRRSAPPAVTFEVESGRPGIANEWVEAPLEHEAPLRFSDGTTVLLAGGTRGRIEQLGPRGARVRIAQGRAAVSVPPGRGAEWTFDVGPFEVAVTGTRFDVGWDPKGEVFELTMNDGSVKVRGPTITGERVVVAGQRLQVPLRASGFEPSSPTVTPVAPALQDSEAQARPALAPVLPPDEPPPSPRPRTATSGAVSEPPAGTVASWQELAHGGAFKEALVSASPQFDSLCRTASAGDLMLLGDTARYAGDVARARRAYVAVRQRFAGARDAASAAFALGRLAFQAEDDASAIDWFALSLREDPEGPLAREALGRLLETRVRHHDTAEASRLAREYLRLYPAGPHAALARSVGEP